MSKCSDFFLLNFSFTFAHLFFFSRPSNSALAIGHWPSGDWQRQTLGGTAELLYL